MKIMKTTIKTLLLVFAVTFFSCQKNDNLSSLTDLSDVQLKSATLTANDVAVESAVEEASYETYFYGEYQHLLRKLAKFKGNGRNLLSGKSNMPYLEGKVPVVSIDTAAAGYPIVISIDYGTGIETKHGRVISGKVEIEISGPKLTDGTTRTVSFIGCSVDTIGIAGGYTETFNGDNTSTRKSTVSSDVTFTLPDGSTIKRSGTKAREWLTGVDTPLDRSDDRIQTTGKTTVVSSTGTYIRQITDAIIHLGDCRYAVQGIVEYTKDGVVIATLNYGDGDCDNLATVTTDGATVEIELKSKGMPRAKTEGVHRGAKKNS